MERKNIDLSHREKTKILELENDGLNMIADKAFLYIRCKKVILKYSLSDISELMRNVVFNKNGKSRGLSANENFIFLWDFCDLYILNKDDLKIACGIHLGEDLSSDICKVRCDSQKAYVSMRNGQIAVVETETWNLNRFKIYDSSFWDMYICNNSIYAGSVGGDLIEFGKSDMQIIRKKELSKKNICSIILINGLIYTSSQDMTIKVISADTFETLSIAKKAVSGMAKIIGIYKNYLVVADSNKIVLFDLKTLQTCEEFEFPTGSFNKGVLLHENKLYGSDYLGVYITVLY